MKTKILSSVLIIFVNYYGFGQKSILINNTKYVAANSIKSCQTQSDTNMIVYNFKDGTFQNNNIQPQYGKPIVFKIKNINRIYYNPSIKGISGENIDESIGLRAPAVTEDSNQKQPNNQNIQQEISNDPVAESRLKINTNSLKELSIDNMGTIQEKVIGISVGNLNTANQLYKIYKEKLSILSKNFQTYVYVINKINSNYNNYLDKINSPDLTYDIYKKIYDDSNLSKDEKNKINPFETASIIVAAKHEKKFMTLNEYFETKVEFKDFLNSKELQDIISILNETDNKIAVDNVKKEIEDWKGYVNKTDEDITKMNLHEKLSYVEKINRILLDKNSYEYVSEPIQAYGDYLSFDVDIKEKRKVNNEYIIFNSNKKFSYKEFVRGDMRLDFGVGVSLDFGHNDQEYSINEDGSGNSYLLENTKSDYYPKLVGLLHASKRSSTNTAIGVSLGTALDVANFDVSSIYIGPSLLWGRSDKIIFTAGPSFRKIKQLNPQFEKYISQEVLPSNFNLDDSKYVNNYKVGFFFSITYNLTNAQRGKFLQVQKNE